MSDLPQRLREARKRVGLSQAAFAEAIGASQGSVSKWEAGKERPSIDTLINIAIFTKQDAAKLWLDDDDHNLVDAGYPHYPNVVGTVEANGFYEEVLWPERSRIEVTLPMPKEVAEIHIEGYLVKGAGCDREYPDGSVVFIVPSKWYSIKIGPGDHVLVHRLSEEGLQELSIRRYTITEDGAVWFTSLSDDPEFQEALNDSDEMGERIVKVAIWGVVIASFQVHARLGRFALAHLIPPRPGHHIPPHPPSRRKKFDTE